MCWYRRLKRGGFYNILIREMANNIREWDNKTRVTTMTLYKEDYDNIDKIKERFWDKANTNAIRRALDHLVNTHGM